MTGQAQSPFYVRVDGGGTGERTSEAVARWESARDQGSAQTALLLLQAALWAAQDVMTDEEVSAAVAGAMGARYPRPVFNVEPKMPRWALGTLEDDPRFQRLGGNVVYVTQAARNALIAGLRNRLVRAAHRTEADPENFTFALTGESIVAMQDARDWLEALGAFPDGVVMESGPSIQPRASYLETLAREALATTEDDAARRALAAVIAQFDTGLTSTAALVDVEIPAALVRLVREGAFDTMRGAANMLDVTSFDDGGDWQIPRRQFQRSAELVDMLDAHDGYRPAHLALTADQAAQLVAAIDYVAVGMEDDARSGKDSAEIIRLAQTAAKLQSLRAAIGAAVA